MMKHTALTALEKVINHTLALDDSMAGKLSQLDGRVLNILITPLGLGFFIHFTHGQMILLDDYEGHIDTTIKSSPLGLIRLSLLPASKIRSLFNDQVHMTGDIELGQQVKQLFDHIDIDWEGHLAQFTGDAIAYQLGSVVRQGIAFKQQLGDSMRQNVTDFLQEECRAFPPREEVNDFFNDIDELSAHVERLTAHMNQLANQPMAPHETY